MPADRVRERWDRSLKNLGWFAPRVDRLLVFDNSSVRDSDTQILVATGKMGQIRIVEPDRLPHITDVLLRAGGMVVR